MQSNLQNYCGVSYTKVGTIHAASLRLSIIQKFFLKLILLLLMGMIPLLGLSQTSWKGVTSTSWGTSSNWTNGIPNANVDAIIGDANFTGSFQPRISSTSYCKSLTIGTGTKASTLSLSSRNKNLIVSGSITIGSNGTIVHSVRSTLSLTGNWSNSGTYSATNSSANVTFAGTTQSLTGATTFKKLTINAGSTTTLSSNIVASSLTLNGTLNPNEPAYTVTGSSNTLILNTGSVLLVKASTFSGNYTFSTITVGAGSIISYAASTINQTVSSALTYGTLRVEGAMTKSLAANLPALNSSTTTTGNITINAGTLDLLTYSANRGTTVAGGSVTIANGAALKIGGTNSFPANYASTNLGGNSTVEYYGNNQTVMLLSYGNLSLSGSSGAVVKTMPTGAMTVAGNFTSMVGAGTSVTFTAGNDLTIKGSLTIGTSTVFNNSSYRITASGNWTNNGTFNGNTGTVSMNGVNKTLNGSGTTNFNNLEIIGVVTASGSTNMNVAGTLSTSSSGVFTHASGGTLTMTGGTGKITGTAISLSNLTVTGSVIDSSSLVIGGNLLLTGSGSFNAHTGTITLSGASNSITNSGSGSLTFHAMTITGNITTASNYSLRSNVAVIGSFTATAGRISLIGSTTISGSMSIYNGTLDGTLLQMGGNSVLNVAGDTPTLISGTFDPLTYTPNTVNYNGTSSQVIVPTTYYDLSFSNAGTKSVNGPVKVLNQLKINSGATFDCSGYTDTLEGDWVNNGTFIAGTGTVLLSGASNQSISGTSTTTFNTLTLEKGSGNDVITIATSTNVATLNMTTGTINIPDTTKSITITTTRTGTGEIHGTIIRNHTFVNDVPYAFESDRNTITFTGGGTNPTSIKQSCFYQEPPDFVPAGTAAQETYTLNQTGGTGYTASIRFTYEEEGLNGNDPATLSMWRYVGGTWVDSGATDRDPVNEWVEKDGITDITGRWTFHSTISGILEWTGAVSTAWTDSANWSIISGAPSIPPNESTYVRLGYSACANQPTISSSVTLRTLSFGSIQPITLTLASGGSLSIAGASGDISGAWENDVTHTILINDQSMTVGGSLLLSPGIPDRRINISIGNGSLNVRGRIDQLANSTVTITGSGMIRVAGDWNASPTASFSCGTGTVVYDGGGNQAVYPFTYYNLDIRKPADVAHLNGKATILGNLTIDSTAGSFQVEVDSLFISGNVSIASGTKLIVLTGLVYVGGNWTRNGSFLPGASTVIFNGTGSQTCSPGTYNRIIVNKPSGTLTPGGNLLTNGYMMINSGSVELSSYTITRSSYGGTFTMGPGTSLRMGTGSGLPGNFATYVLDSTSTQEFYGTNAQAIPPATYGNLTLTNGTSTAKVLSGAVTVGGNFLINSSASLSAGAWVMTLRGNWTNNGTFNPDYSTVILDGSSKSMTFSGACSVYNLNVQGSYTLSTSLCHIQGDFNVTGSFDAGTTTSVLDGNFTNYGTLVTNGTTTFTGTREQTIHLFNAMTATASAVVNFNGTVAPVLYSTTAPNFATVNINNTAGVSPSIGWNVYGPLTIASGAAFYGGSLTHNFYHYVTNNGTMTSSGTLNFSPAVPATIKLSGTLFSSSGTCVFGGSKLITVQQAATSLFNVIVTNTNSAGISIPFSWNINNDFIIAYGATFHCGDATVDTIGGTLSNDGVFDGNTSTIYMTNPDGAEVNGSGTTTFNNITISGTITALNDFIVLGNMSNTGTLDASGATIVFTGPSPSTISSSTTPLSLPDVTNLKSNATTTLGVNLSDVTELHDSTGTLNLSTYTVTQDAAGGKLVVSDSALLQIGGTNTLPAFDTLILGPLSTVEYNGTGAQSVSNAAVYGNLTLSNSGTKTASGGLHVRSNFSLSTGTFVGGSYTDTIGGNWTMSSGTFNKTGNTILFNGTGSQVLSSTGAFNNLTVNKSTGRISTASDITVNGTLSLTNGTLITGSNKVVLPQNASATRTNGYVAGSLQKYMPTGATSATFEIGDTTVYTPVNLAFANVATAGSVLANTTQGDHPNIASSLINPSMSVNRYWTLTNVGTAFSTYNATFNFVPADLDSAAITGGFVVARRSEGAWSLLSTGTRTSTSTQATGLTAFSDFQIGDSVTNPVPTTTGLSMHQNCWFRFIYRYS